MFKPRFVLQLDYKSTWERLNKISEKTQLRLANNLFFNWEIEGIRYKSTFKSFCIIYKNQDKVDYLYDITSTAIDSENFVQESIERLFISQHKLGFKTLYKSIENHKNCSLIASYLDFNFNTEDLYDRDLLNSNG